ncbi:phage major capsid protein [Streptosporangium algeriense]|uniref:Phage major capsid protein n=2 Tax=Streptosporangium TaxID=2000 RepID=A0ABW3DMA6_9ACTN
MTTLAHLIAAAQRQKVAAQRRVSDAEAKADRILQRCKDEGRRTVTLEEEERIDALIAEKRAASDLVKEATAEIELLREEQRQEAEIVRLQSQIHPTGVTLPGQDRVIRVGAEARTYQPPQADRDGRGVTGPSFLRDLFMSQVHHDPAASERLARHGREIEIDNPGFALRAINTGAVSGFVPPQYLVEMFAEYARAGRPVANLCRRLPLPEKGMTVDIPRVTTPTTVGVQASENATVSNQDLDDTMLQVPVVTVAGYVDTSRQSIERGVIIEEVLFADLAAAYAASLDAQVINGSGSSGQHLGLLNVSGANAITYTDASPTVPELWPKLADAVGKVMAGRFTGPTAMVSHPSLWAWLLAERDTTGRPMFEPSGVAFNPMGTTDNPTQYGSGPQGNVLVPFVASGSVPTNLGAGTNETRIIVADFRDCILMEDASAAPAQLRFDEPLSNSLGVRLVAYGYSAFASGRQPKAISVVSGTGLIVPAL